MDSTINRTNIASDAIRKAALADAWDSAVSQMPSLALLQPSGGSLDRVMGEAIDLAIASGVLDHALLVETALSKIPRLRSPDGHTPQHPNAS